MADQKVDHINPPAIPDYGSFSGGEPIVVPVGSKDQASQGDESEGPEPASPETGAPETGRDAPRAA